MGDWTDKAGDIVETRAIGVRAAAPQLAPERLAKALYEAMKIELPWLTFSASDVRRQYADGLAERVLSLLRQWEQEN